MLAFKGLTEEKCCLGKKNIRLFPLQRMIRENQSNSTPKQLISLSSPFWDEHDEKWMEGSLKAGLYCPPPLPFMDLLHFLRHRVDSRLDCILLGEAVFEGVH